MKEEWVAKTPAPQSVVSYVLEMRNKLDKMGSIARESEETAKIKTKVWYDRDARSRSFTEGDQVLVLLPVGSDKLSAQWQGPYTVLKQVSPVSYCIDMHDKRKRQRQFHVNMLKEWHSPAAAVLEVAIADQQQPPSMDGEDMEFVTVTGNTGLPEIGEHLTVEQRGELDQLLVEFGDVFSVYPGRTNAAEHTIDTGDASPFRLAPYRVPKAWEEKVRDELKSLLDQGVIKPSKSPWASPIVVVGKKDGDVRICIDYRRLNSITVSDPYQMPRVDDMLDRLGRAKYLSTIDLTKGYYQVPVRASDQEKTAFVTPFGKYQFCTMPFGLKGAPTTFQRLMDIILEGMQDFSSAYIDDISIFSDSWPEHLHHLRQVFMGLLNEGLKAKKKKCKFAVTKCSHLGHVIGQGRVEPEQTKVEAVREFSRPKTKKDVRAFLGLVGYYRRFLPDFSSRTACLSDLTRAVAPNAIQWREEHQLAFDSLKEELTRPPVLLSPNFEKPFRLQTDASERGIGAVLSQDDDEGVEHPVAFYSKKLLPRETRYSTVEKECLAIVAAMKHFRVYLLGKKFEIQTDHQALRYLDRMQNSNGRLTRWSLAIQPFDFDVTYRPGLANDNADGLSRQSWEDQRLPPEGEGDVRDGSPDQTHNN